MSSIQNEPRPSALSSGNGEPVTPDSAAGGSAVRELHREIRSAVSADGGDPVSRAAELARLEAQLSSDGAGDGGDAFLADAQELRKTCRRLGLAETAAAVDRLADAFLENVAERWSDSVRPLVAAPSANACFEALLRTATLMLEALAHSAGSAEAIEVLERARGELREAFLRALAAEPPTDETRRRWATELLDRGDQVLTSLDEARPDCAADQLRVVAGDLAWYVQHVESSSGELRRRLQWKLARLNAERQERRLQERLESRFGRRFIVRTDRGVLLLILVVMGVLLAQALLPLSDRAIFWLDVVDGLACSVFLAEFATRLWYVEGRLSWFRRHFLFGLVPCIPYGLLLHGLSTPRTLKAARAALFTLRLSRGFGLLIRAFDRLARQYGHVLNQNVILYPTRAELERARAAVPLRRSEIWRARLELRQSWKQLLTSCDAEERPQVAATRLAALQAEFARAVQDPQSGPTLQAIRTREIPASVLIEQLEAMTPPEVEAGLGEELAAQLAYVTRTLSRPPLRWLPIISSIAPRLSSEMTDAEVVSAGARRFAAVLRRFHNAYFWVADLYGTVSPSEFVDRVGTMLVNSSFRPAYRLLLFGGVFLLFKLVLNFLEYLKLHSSKDADSVLLTVAGFFERLLGTTLLVLGSVCLFILAVGLWLRRIAREATEFYERSAQAQFLALTEMIRSRYLERDAAILYDRVLRPEWTGSLREGEAPAEPHSRVCPQSAARQEPRPPDLPESLSRQEHLRILSERIEHSLVRAHAGSDGDAALPGLETSILLYRDWLDGALLADTDTRTTSQLLGNPAVRQFLYHSERVGRRQIKALQVLDLDRQKSLFGGPYLWFNFISRSIAHSVACLLVDYNQNAIPVAELPLVTPAEREAYRRWLSGETAAPTATDVEVERLAEERYVTTAFTALHFLDYDPQRDQQVEARFGPEMLRRLQDDRSLMIRRIFGTFPMHDRPKAERVVNLYSMYCSWLAGGRVILLPLFLMGRALKFIGDLLGWVRYSVREIRNPDLRTRNRDAARAHFLTAVRKIERIRGPVVAASLRLRMKFDPEYLGIPVPGCERSLLHAADVDADLRFLRPEAALVEEVEQERRRAEADMRRLERMIEDGLLREIAERRGLVPDALSSPAHARAAACAYLADYRGVRRRLSAREIVHEVCERAAVEPPPPAPRRPRLRLRRAFRRYWKEHGRGGTRERRAAWRAVIHNQWGAADALRLWDEMGERARSAGEATLGELLIHPGRLSEQLLALRMIQTLAVLDVLNYREHVFHLGRYAEMGDSADEILRWETCPTMQAGSLCEVAE